MALFNARELVTCAGENSDMDEGPLGIIEDGALLSEGGRVTWVGTTKDFRRKLVGKPKTLVDAGQGLVTPGFVDPHTHLVYAGSREDELARKAKGESYTSILKSGGGILRTIRDTRRAAASKIVKESRARLYQLLRNGVTTAEVKTGYGQNVADEIKLISVIQHLARRGSVELVPTFLGLHATPDEFKKPGEYAKFVVNRVLPRIAELKGRPVFSDCFCEEGVFSAEQCSSYLRASEKLGFMLKVHADEFSDSGGASLAAEMKCVSADHLGRSSAEGLSRMARKGVTAVLLPGTSLYSGIPYADARKVMDAGCTVALGTDLSPNSWVESPQLVMGLACAGMKMTASEALRGFTSNAAAAIGRTDLGRLAVGCIADFVIHSLPNHRFLPYRLGGDYVSRVFKEGRQVYSAREG